MKKLGIIALTLLFFTAATAKTVRVSEFNPDPKDSTLAIRAAIDSGADKIIFDDPGYEYLSDMLEPKSNQEWVLADKVVLRALPRKFKDPGSNFIRIGNVSNVTIRGEGSAIIKMNKSDYQDQKQYKPSEHRHAICIRSTGENFIFRDLTIAESGGDGVYIGGMPKNVRLENLLIRDHHRLGVGVIGVENLLIKKCRIINTRGTAPEAGIDFEPNRRSQNLINCVVDDCDISGNSSFGIYFSIFRTLEKPLSITVKNCRIAENGNGAMAFDVGGDHDLPLKGAINLVNCKVSAPQYSALHMMNLREKGLEVVFRDCILDNRENTTAPIRIGTKHVDDIAGLDFGTLILLQEWQRPVFDIMSLGAAAIRPVKGSILVRRSDGKEQKYDLARLSKDYPGNPDMRNFATSELTAGTLAPIGKHAVSKNLLQLRGDNVFVQYAKAGETIPITFHTAWNRPNSNIKFPVQIVHHTGTIMENFVIDKENFTYEFKPNLTGVYSFHCKVSGAINISSPASGHGYAAGATGLKMFRNQADLYFNVPGDLKRVCVEVTGIAGEMVEATLIDASGRVLAHEERFHGTKFLAADRTETQASELWLLRTTKVQEDYYVRLGAPLVPLVFTDPANALIEQ